ncbi:dockerin type I domain-containing protein [Bythopirellula polymerisocia]|uniref:Glycoside hydrolase family 5 domain-containing protein n=1 Tax=Bythopirellula polymerisocia TaxID=2528003 RepID=A0A5C6CJ30_9BACT|nr:dockerin type I domain-containing protein [Bythopirellula polymerisocia]TWU22789.1 hypothetical protein Pla144_42500 [Bythopirellula polymerisocia]
MSLIYGYSSASYRLLICFGFSCAWLVATSQRASCDDIHGLNAGAPIWNGAIQLTPQKAAQFAATGTDSIRVNFRLDSGATSWNTTQLELYDEVIQNAKNAGLRILGLFSNETVAGGQTSWNFDPDGDGMNSYVNDFADTAQFLVDRYKNDIKQFEIWNEPNAWSNSNYPSDPQNAGGTYILPRVYAKMLSETYRHLNTGGQTLLSDFNISLTTGGLLAHDIGGSFSTAMPYFQQVYDQSSVWNSFQADTGLQYPWNDFGYHFYISQGSLVSTSQLSSYFNAVRSTQAANNDFSNVAVTEFGWQTVGSNTEQLQRDNMATAYNFLENQPYISGSYWYQWVDDGTGAWGIVHGNGVHKLSYDEFAARNNSSQPGGILFSTEHAANDGALSHSFSSSDILQGLIATERPGDKGWHSANPAATNGSSDPDGLPAFTDGIGDIGTGLTGLLNDFPGSGSPAKLLEYELGGAYDIDEIRIFTGNNGADGRIFSTTGVWTSNDGSSFEFLGYFQSDSSGVTNNSTTPGGPDGSTLVRIFRDDAIPLATDITHLRFDLYAVSNVDGVMFDPFNGVNSFTGTDDGFETAYVSPLVREIDVFGALSIIDNADFDGDDDVDGIDFLIWQRNFLSGTTLSEGDANSDGRVDETDLAIWQSQYGLTTSSVSHLSRVPESNSLIYLLLICLTLGSHRSNKQRL